MVEVLQKDEGYIVTIIPENKDEIKLLESILNFNKKKMTRQEEYDYWTIKPQKKVEQEQMSLNFRPVDNECPFLEDNFITDISV